MGLGRSRAATKRRFHELQLQRRQLLLYQRDCEPIYRMARGAASTEGTQTVFRVHRCEGSAHPRRGRLAHHPSGSLVQ